MRNGTRRALGVVAVALAGATSTAAPGHAAGPGVSPAAYCREHRQVATSWDGRVLDAYWVPLLSAGQAGLYRFPLLTLDGCVSTVAAGMADGYVASTAISLPAARAQCAWLEEVRGVRYPTTIFGSEVTNRTACGKALLRALAVLPPPPGGPPV